MAKTKVNISFDTNSVSEEDDSSLNQTSEDSDGEDKKPDMESEESSTEDVKPDMDSRDDRETQSSPDNDSDKESTASENTLQNDPPSDDVISDGGTIQEGSAGSIGWANVMKGILKKEAPKHVILPHAKSDRQKSDNKQKVEPTVDAKVTIKVEEEQSKAVKKRQWEEMGRLKPKVTEREKEKRLQKVATRGVVQLFNAVKKQQKSIEDRIQQTSGSEIQRSKVLKSISKGDFLDMLKHPSSASTPVKPQKRKHGKEVKQVKEESISEIAPRWKVLREDFMLGAGMKDWDKESGSNLET